MGTGGGKAIEIRHLTHSQLLSYLIVNCRQRGPDLPMWKLARLVAQARPTDRQRRARRMEQTVRSRYHKEFFNNFRSLTISIRSGTLHYHDSVHIEPSMVTLLIPMTDLGRISINAYSQV